MRRVPFMTPILGLMFRKHINGHPTFKFRKQRCICTLIFMWELLGNLGEPATPTMPTVPSSSVRAKASFASLRAVLATTRLSAQAVRAYTLVHISLEP
eukprot:352787-Chlamydomonas_euryale.AAC.1